MISASVGVNSSLLLEPAQTLTFALGASPASPAKAKTSRACLTLTNISLRKRVVYKVRTTNVDMFVVKPAQGVIEPSSDVAIVITLTPPACERLLRMTPDDRAAIVERFLIQSIDRSDDMRGFSVDDLATFWKRLPKELITNKKLTCKFMDARDVEPGVLSSLQRLRLPSDEPIVEDHLSSSMHQYNRQPPPPPPSPPSRGNQDGQAPRGGSVSPPLRQGRQIARTPPIAMNLPSSPVPSLRPKTATPSQPTAFPPNSYLSEGSEDSYSVNGDGHGDVDLDLDSGFSGVSHGSNDSYATRKNPEAEFPEIIESEDRLEFRLHPSESLVFPVHHAYPDDAERGIVEGKSYFFITNKARHSGLAFKIKTSHHTGYFVKPARGFIDAKTAQRVDVFVNAPDAARFNARDREMKDRFLVELLFIPPSQSIELWAMPEERKRQQLQVVWDASKAADRRQAVLTCQILEEDTPIDPTHQTAEQARALLSKSQAAALHNKSSNSLRQDSLGESANPWVHPPLSPAMHTPRGNQYQHQNQQFYQQQPRSPVIPQARSPAHQQPRSPARPQPRSPVQPRSPSVPPPPQPYYNHRKEAMPPNVPRFDDDRTYYA